MMCLPFSSSEKQQIFIDIKDNIGELPYLCGIKSIIMVCFKKWNDIMYSKNLKKELNSMAIVIEQFSTTY